MHPHVNIITTFNFKFYLPFSLKENKCRKKYIISIFSHNFGRGRVNILNLCFNSVETLKMLKFR